MSSLDVRKGQVGPSVAPPTTLGWVFICEAVLAPSRLLQVYPWLAKT